MLCIESKIIPDGAQKISNTPVSPNWKPEQDSMENPTTGADVL